MAFRTTLNKYKYCLNNSQLAISGRCFSSSNVDQSLNKLDNIINRMKVSPNDKLLERLKSHGCSSLFNYATNKRFNQSELHSDHLKLYQKIRPNTLPLNGFEELVRLTEQGKLWQYPIDNEQGLDGEKQVPFEDHVFLGHLLEDFPKLQFIQSFMQLVADGLAKNPWMTVKRKHEVIAFYKDYFEKNKHLYEDANNAQPPPEYQ